MNAAAVARELVLMVVSPLGCRLRGHLPHVWQHHAGVGLRICDRCGRRLQLN